MNIYDATETSYKNGYAKGFADGKAEGAREIFEEMQVLLMLRMGVNEVIAELKKKYTEEQTSSSR